MIRAVMLLALLTACGDRERHLDLNVQQPTCLFFCLTVLHVHKTEWRP